MTNGETGGFLERLRSSPRTVSTVIVILIVLGAIFAFSDRGAPSPAASPAPAGAATEASPTPDEAEETAAPEGEETPAPEVKEETAEREATPEPTSTPLPEAQETETGYEEVAQAGDGATHLARRAMLRHLEANKPDFEVTGAHKVFIEDFLKDRLGASALTLGEQKTIEKSAIADAVAQAKTLSDAQVKNLQRFAARVAAYR